MKNFICFLFWLIKNAPCGALLFLFFPEIIPVVLPVMRYITSLIILFFITTAVQIISRFRLGPVTRHLFVLHIILTSATFHKQLL
jgi:hypothetical protein